MRRFALAPLLALPFLIAHCSDDPSPVIPPPTPVADSGVDAKPDPDPDPDPPLVPASKVDILFVVDNSSSMGDKQVALANSASTLIRRLAPVGDLHIGFISTSLGSAGGDVCPDSGRYNDQAHLLAKEKGTGLTIANDGFLSYTKNGDLEKVVADAQKIVVGVDQTGCGLESQLEAAYRFLVAPDPWAKASVDGGKLSLDGVDATLLAQRKAFLRPDSAVAVVMLTDEDDSGVDPMALGKRGWWFSSFQFPGSHTFRADGKTTTAVHRTSACDKSLLAASCTSCALAYGCADGDASCDEYKADPACSTYFGPNEDDLNVRFFHMKERFGASPQFPVQRYIDGFSKRKVAKRDAEHDAQGNYLGGGDCTNPLFAAQLPDPKAPDLCHLPEGTRSRRLVYFTLIGGVPDRLVHGGAPTADDWTKILGKDPDTYDRTGIDPHMIQSTTPRDGLVPPSSTKGDNGSDPDTGREWDTGNTDLQYACTFALPTPRACVAGDPSCDCNYGSKNPPLCSADGSQIRAKAYPTIRELQVAKGLGDRAVVSSICAVDGNGTYGAAMNALADRLAPVLAH